MHTRGAEKRPKPEVALLLCCARRTLDAAQAARLKSLLQGTIDWDFLFALATQNGLLPLVCEHLGRFSVVPTQFRESNRQNALRALFLTAELLRITDIFRRRRIPALPYKGPVVGQMAYANPLLRQFSDLDFVVPQGRIADVYAEMEGLGYEPKFKRPPAPKTPGAYIPGEYVFLHKVNRAMVEIHTESTLRHFPRPLDLRDISSRSMEITLNGRQVSTFGWADTLLLLCVHGAKDFWARLIWVADVVEVIEKLDQGDWQRLLVEAKRYDAERMLRIGLWLAREIFGSSLPATTLQDMENDRAIARIGTALCEPLLYQREHSQGIAGRSYYRIRMVRPIWKGIAYWLRLSTAPAEEDWATAVAVPGYRARYMFLRPLRLWRKYSRSSESTSKTE